jgi:hypothetical protein
MVCRVAKSKDLREVCIGRTFSYEGDGGTIDGTFEMYREEKVRGDVVRVRMDTHEKRSTPSAATCSGAVKQDYAYFHPRRWNPNIFPHLNRTAPVETQQAQLLSDLKAYSLAQLFPHAEAIGADLVLFWDGFNGWEHPEITLNGDPSYYPPEFTQAMKREYTAWCLSHGFRCGECIRPTVRDAVNLTQLYPADPQALYNQRVAASIADGCSGWWFDSSLFGTEGQTPLEANQFFPKPGIAAMAAAHPDCEFFFEWYDHANYADIPNLWAWHDPAGTPGVVGYNPDAGYLPSDVPDDPAWDAHGIYYADQRVDPRDPVQRAALAASYARGARIFLYAGADFDPGTGYSTGAQRADLYALWLANYRGASSAGGASGQSGGSTMPSEFEALFSDSRSLLLGHHGDSTVTYTAAGAAAVPVTAIVGAVAEDLIELVGERTRQLHRHRPLTVSLADAPSPKRGEKFTISGEAWTVHSREPQDGGMARLVVVRPVRAEEASRRIER